MTSASDFGKYQPSPEQLAFSAAQYQPRTATQKNKKSGSSGAFRFVLLLLFLGAVALGGLTYKKYLADQASTAKVAANDASDGKLSDEEWAASLTFLNQQGTRPSGLPDPDKEATESVAVLLCKQLAVVATVDSTPRKFDSWPFDSVSVDQTQAIYPGTQLTSFEQVSLVGFTAAAVGQAASHICA